MIISNAKVNQLYKTCVMVYKIAVSVLGRRRSSFVLCGAQFVFVCQLFLNPDCKLLVIYDLSYIHLYLYHALTGVLQTNNVTSSQMA